MQNLGQSFRQAGAGIGYCFRHERNMRIHGLAALAAIVLGCWCRLKPAEWGLLSITIMSVLVAEMINTAIERTVDLITDQYRPLARIAKNTAAGAVLLAAVNSVIMGGIIFGPYILGIWRG